MIKAFLRWRCRRRIARFQRRVEYYFELRREYAQKAYDTDMHANPLSWGRLQNAANWAGWHYRLYMDKLHTERELEKQA